MFDVNLVWLKEGLVRDQLYGIGPVGGCEAVGDRVCDWHQKILNLMSSLRFFIIVIYFP